MYLSLLLLRCRGQWKWRNSVEKNGTKLSAGNPSQWCQRSELLEGREDTSGEFCCVEVVWWNPHQNWDHLLQMLPSQHKVDLSRSPCVYLMTSLVQHSIWQLHKRIASQWISVNVGESKGGFVSWGRCGYPLSSEDVRQISASEEKSVPWSPQQFVGKVLLNSESSGGGTGLCCLFFLTCEPSHTYQGNDLLTPGIGAVGFALPAGVKFRQGDFFLLRWILDWPQHTVLFLVMCIFGMATTFLRGAGGFDGIFPSVHCWSDVLAVRVATLG